MLEVPHTLKNIRFSYVLDLSLVGYKGIKVLDFEGF
jgi:hypothetical protein